MQERHRVSEPPPIPMRTQFWKHLKLFLLTLSLIVLILCAGCMQTEILYARATKLPEEVDGFMRVAQKSVQVNVVGRQEIADVECAGYLLIHEQDLAKLIDNTRKLLQSE